MFRARNLPWIGLLAGTALGVIDLGGMLLLGVRMDIAGVDATIPVMLVYTLTFAALCFTIGKLVELHRRLQVQLGELEASQERLVQAEKLASLGRMAAGVAHEVRNPLGVIRSAASLVAEATPDADDDVRQACAFMVEEVDRLDGFIRTILDFSRPIHLDRREVDLDAVVSRAATLAGDHLDGVEVRVGALPARRYRGDPDLLVQVVMSLLVNAGEADAHQVEIRVEDGPREVCIELADDGPGVADADAQQVFEPFFTRKAKGTGLGLAMARRIAEAHRGRLELLTGRGAGAAGEGACFRLCLPLGAR